MVQNSEGTKGSKGKKNISLCPRPFISLPGGSQFCQIIGCPYSDALCFNKYIFLCINRREVPAAPPKNDSMIETLFYIFLKLKIYSGHDIQRAVQFFFDQLCDILLHKLILFNQPFIDEHLSCLWSFALETILKSILAAISFDIYGWYIHRINILKWNCQISLQRGGKIYTSFRNV